MGVAHGLSRGGAMAGSYRLGERVADPVAAARPRPIGGERPSAAELQAARLEIEITEGVLLHNTIDALRTLAELKDIGIRIVIDDFGTGFSSFSYLQEFPLDKLKIDRSFIASLYDDNCAIVRAIIGLGRSLGMDTCAEGLETEEQVSLLRREGCHQAQGFKFGRAMPPAMIDRLIAKANRVRPPRLRAVG
jgi:EAL domain-containing protein (putative c-di-GMP-specific phosphodiesterase class I)